MSEVTISCPHCRRQYNMKIDPERLQRLKTRATCGRCGKTFDAASRIVSPSATTNPSVKRPDVTPPPSSQLVPSIKAPPSKTPTDEMEELAREFAEAAARFTPVGVKRPDVRDEETSTNPGVKPRALVDTSKVHTPLNEVLESMAGELDAVLATPPPATLAEIAAASGRAPAEEPAPSAPAPVDDDDDAYDELITAEATRTRAVAAPRSWLDLADPGLASLQPPPSPGASALELLLEEAQAPATSPSAS